MTEQENNTQNQTLEEIAGTPWHALDFSEALSRLRTDAQNGLTVDEVRRRLMLYGSNTIEERKGKNRIFLFFSQFNDFIIWVLLAAAVLSGFVLREYVDASVIMAIVILNAVLGYAQESRAEKALREIRKMAAPTANVIRSSEEFVISAEQIVPGDLLVLEVGDIVPADARLVTSVNLRTNESRLTGESTSIDKDANALVEGDCPVADRINMVFTGTHIDYGRGIAVVTTTGKYTELGKIASILEEAKEPLTPLQVSIKEFGKRVVYACLIIACAVFVLGLLRGNKFVAMLLFAVSLAVAAIPEGLPAVLTVTLAMGTQAMAKRNAIIRRLPAVETLGCASYICSDKTGTLTENHMTVVKAITANGESLAFKDYIAESPLSTKEKELLLMAVSLCNDAREDHAGGAIGDPTETALVEAAKAAGLNREEVNVKFPRIAEIPFDSERKMMTTIHRDLNNSSLGKAIMLSKGATESVLKACSTAMVGDNMVTLDRELRNRILETVEREGNSGLRSIAAAYRYLPDFSEQGKFISLESDMTFLGALSMIDPPRPEAKEALQTCRKAHIEVAMITGDHLATAVAIARELGILNGKSEFIDGTALEEMSAQELAKKVEKIGVYARVSPLHKVKIIEALKSKNHIVAMTGDGVNDAPALKKADIGVAMGVTGTEVAKEASDMILADDNFATIVAAVREGRIIYANLKKFIYYLLSTNIGIVFSLFIAMLIGYPLPLLPVQVLWINLVTNGMPALALGFEPPEPHIMEEPPRSPDENILSLSRLARLLWQGCALTIGAVAAMLATRYLLGFSWNTASGLEAHRTVLFTTIVVSDVLHSFNWRFERRSFLRTVPWENIYLLLALIVSLLLQISVLYIPPMQQAFHTIAPSASMWGVILICSTAAVLTIDRVKVWFYRSHKPA